MSTGIARTIVHQIGNLALSMIGAKDLVDCGDALRFKVGRNPKKVTHVKVTLKPTDTYTLEFIKVGRAPGFKVETLSEVEGIYCDQLRIAIASGTGLATSL